MNIQFKRQGIASATVKITDESYVNRNVMGDCTAYIEFRSVAPVDLQPGDNVMLLGNTYFIADPVVPERDFNRLIYRLTLYGTQNELEKAKYFILDTTGVDMTAETTYNCTPLQFLTQLIVNIKRVQPTVDWQAGDCLVGPLKNMTLSNNSCLEMLRSAAQLWEVDYYVSEFTVSLKKTEVSLTPLALEVGPGGGLREITANKSGDSSVITKLYAYGADTNMSTRQKLSIPPVYVVPIVEIVEGIKDFPEIYPRILGEVLSLEGVTGFMCNSLGFLIDDYLIPGDTPLITFLSGELQGLQFAVHQVPNLPQVLWVDQVEISGGVFAPGSPGYQHHIGDTFVIWNINIPGAYVTAAQTELYDAAVAYLATASKQKTKLNIVTDDLYFMGGVALTLGETVNVKSDIVPQLSEGLSLNVLGYKQFITRPYKYDTLVVGDVYFSQPFNEKVTIIANGYKSAPAGSDAYYRHTQNTPSALWTVNHNLGKRPAVTIANLDGTEKEGKINYQTTNPMNMLTVVFSGAVTGTAECN